MEEKSFENNVFKIADSEDEFRQIHHLNYETFVDEIPQHERNEERMLVDKFHEQNTYLILKKGQDLIGMVCICDKRPFSIESKLENFESYLPDYKHIFETRLLVLRKEYRGRIFFGGLVRYWYEYWLEKKFDLSVVSGTLRQIKMYKHMGFVPFGPLVGTKEAPYQPMYLTLDSLREYVEKKLKMK